jgi:hypothetical protein
LVISPALHCITIAGQVQPNPRRPPPPLRRELLLRPELDELLRDEEELRRLLLELQLLLDELEPPL